jgi:lipoate-protein ligase A
VPLSGDVSEVVDYLRLGEKEKERARAVLRERAATLLQVLQRQISFSEAAAALTTGLAAELQVNWETAGFSDYELAAAERLVKEKYGNESWNRRS